MSRRFASHQPADVVTDEMLLEMLYGRKTRRRPPCGGTGCTGRCCREQSDARLYAWQRGRAWWFSDRNLLAGLAAAVAVLLAVRLAWLAVLGGL